MHKRGLSEVITTLIIIVISLIAIGLVWAVAQQIISEETEDISLAGFKINIKILRVEIDGNNINVNTKRNVGQGNLIGIKFIFSDEKNTEAKERTFSLKELESKAFDFTLDDLNTSEIKSVSIAPIYLSDSRKEVLGNIADTYKIVKSGSVSGNGGTGEEACIPNSDPCETAECGIVTNGTCGNVNCGTCGSGFSCIEGSCIIGECTPNPDPCGTAECGIVTNGTCGNVNCGTCGSGFSCDGGSCTVETIINSGIVDLTWPPGMNLFFDSFDLSTTQSYAGNYVKFPGSMETRCLFILEHILPSEPESYNKSFVRLGRNNEKNFVASGNNYEIWRTSSCGS